MHNNNDYSCYSTHLQKVKIRKDNLGHHIFYCHLLLLVLLYSIFSHKLGSYHNLRYHRRYYTHHMTSDCVYMPRHAFSSTVAVLPFQSKYTKHELGVFCSNLPLFSSALGGGNFGTVDGRRLGAVTFAIATSLVI